MISFDRSPTYGVTLYHKRAPVRRMNDAHELRTFLWQLALAWDHVRIPTPDGAVRLTTMQVADLVELCAMHLRQVTSLAEAEGD